MTDHDIREHVEQMKRMRKNFLTLWFSKLKKKHHHQCRVELAAAMIQEWNAYRGATEAQ